MNTNAVHFQDVKWSAGLIKDFGPLSHQITRTYAKRCKKRGADFDSSVRRDANAWLRDAHEMLTRAHPMFRQIHSNEDIDDKARWCAKQCEPFLTETQLDVFVMAHGLPSVPGQGEGRLRRSADWQFWRRVVRRLVSQWRDQLMRHLGYVHRHRQIYCCDHVVSWQKGRAEANRRVLERMVYTSNEGDEMTLAEIQDCSVANPSNRFAELMVRCRGVEEYAADNGYTAIAITLTAPSKYHARHHYGAANKKYNGATPRDTNDYLVGVFAKIRAKFKRRGFEWFGYRVVEAHHDGSPHWHLMLFIRESDRTDIEAIFRHYALLEDGDEPGAKKHRVKFEDIDERRGSATAYMAKYIAKNMVEAPEVTPEPRERIEPDVVSDEADEAEDDESISGWLVTGLANRSWSEPRCFWYLAVDGFRQ